MSSAVTMFLVFEIIILGLLEVTQLENFIFLLLLACTCYFFYKMKAIADFELATGSSKGKEYRSVSITVKVEKLISILKWNRYTGSNTNN